MKYSPEKKKKLEKINEMKSCFLKRSTKLIALPGSSRGKKKNRAQINKIRNERVFITNIIKYRQS